MRASYCFMDAKSKEFISFEILRGKEIEMVFIYSMSYSAGHFIPVNRSNDAKNFCLPSDI